MLKWAVRLYLLGLLTFYTFAVFDTRAWDISYFAWSKACDGGIMLWGALYFNLPAPKRDTVKWVFYFSFIRFVFDIQSWVTGIGVNNETVVAIIFALLCIAVLFFSVKEEVTMNKQQKKRG